MKAQHFIRYPSKDEGIIYFVNKCIKYTFLWLQQSSPTAALATVTDGLAGWIEFNTNM